MTDPRLAPTGTPADPARRLLMGLAAGGAALAAGACTTPAPVPTARPRRAGEGPRGTDAPLLRGNPFTLGVASGEPVADGFVIWTRLLPDPLDPDSIEPVRHAVRWEVAEDEAFARVVAQGEAWAWPERAHTVHVDVTGLRPDRWYHYRFHAGEATSRTGRSRTAPAAGGTAGRLRVAVASCQHYELGYFGAYRHMLAEDVDLVLFLGDYLYESNRQGSKVRTHASAVPTDLDGYRRRYAQYRADADLQRMHAAAPWLMTWDDHEVENDYAGNQAQDLAAGFHARRAAAYQAWAEHMPVRRMAKLPPPTARIFIDWSAWQVWQALEWGGLARFLMLDDRQYRSPQACPRPGRGGSNVVEADACPQLFEPARTLLGDAQERWLDAELRRARAGWTLLGQQTLFAKIDGKPGPGERFWTDGWDGYPAARRRLLQSLAASGAPNPVFLGGDVHAHWVCDVKADFDVAASPVIATEFCGTSITSNGGPQSRHDAAKAENPWVKLAESRSRGYLVLDVEAARTRAALRIIDDPRKPEPVLSTLARFVVDSGRPGAQAD